MSPLAKKLLIKPAQHWLVLNAPGNYIALLGPLPEHSTLTFSIDTDNRYNGVQLFVKNRFELATDLLLLKTALTNETILWIIYPKKKSGIETDLEMMGSWDELVQYGLRPVASVAINDTWTALRFKPDHLVKKADTSKAAIKVNDYAAYIDADKKQVNLPPDILTALSAAPNAFTFFESLSWSNKKEYVLWILTARQEQTRTERITKMVGKLLAGRKNPSEK